eukprot:scaffold866_cov111-Isochrysis_galbana.AAC.5
MLSGPPTLPKPCAPFCSAKMASRIADGATRHAQPPVCSSKYALKLSSPSTSGAPSTSMKVSTGCCPGCEKEKAVQVSASKKPLSTTRLAVWQVQMNVAMPSYSSAHVFGVLAGSRLCRKRPSEAEALMFRKSYGSQSLAQYSTVVSYNPVAATPGTKSRSARTLNRCGVDSSVRVRDRSEVPNMRPAPIITFGDEKSIAMPIVTSTETRIPADSALASAPSYRLHDLASRPREATVRTADSTSDAMPPASAYAS